MAKHTEDNCVFCKIVKGEISSYKVYEDDDIYAFLDISPASKGHVLVTTKEHFQNFLMVPRDLVEKAFMVAQKIGQVQMSLLGAEGVNVLTNVNEVAGQSVMHFHIHVIPRYRDDSLEIGFKPKMIQKYDLPVLAEQLHKGLSNSHYS
jgi:histidine triad (HIT) family protein